MPKSVLRSSWSSIGSALARTCAEDETKKALEEVQRLRDQLQRENVYLQQEVKSALGHRGLIGNSTALRKVLEQVDQVAGTNSSVLLCGETGTGKELIASAIHELSSRGKRPMVRLNCAAIPETLIESELFGREKGAYTGALSRQAGRFEVAHGSTLFLDEIGELPLDVSQAPPRTPGEAGRTPGQLQKHLFRCANCCGHQSSSGERSSRETVQE
jgi:formate hydrogenlyase transcriptional activator